MRPHRIAQTLAVAAILWATPGLAQPAPVATSTPLTVETKYVKATVTIEDRLKHFPGLYDNLIAEGRRELGKRRAEAAKDAKSDPAMFEDGRHYEFERGYFQRSVIGSYVSVTRNDYEDGLGAHPNRLVDTILWEAMAKKRISIRPFFKESTASGPTLKRLAHLIRVALAAEKKARDVIVGDPDTDTQLSGVEPDLLKMGAVALAPSTEKDRSAGLLFYFPPYAVGSYVEGEYTAFIPWSALKDDLSPLGTGLFGGNRPDGDEKND
jgi:hypothetical protein